MDADSLIYDEVNPLMNHPQLGLTIGYWDGLTALVIAD